MLFLKGILSALLVVSNAIAAAVPTVELARRAPPANVTLYDFQVSTPVLTPTGTSNRYGCIHTTTLMEYTFANSYGAPFVGSYTPPPCSFNRVVMTFTVTSAGRQFDRLALMYLGDIEVWRTSTAEPTQAGIVWTYQKEMQQYNALWRQPQKIIFDLGNIVDSTYTGPYVTSLTATFFTVPEDPITANQILPISSRASASNAGSVFQIPNQQAIVNYSLPNNVERAVVTLAANGQIDEEFWYSNTFNSLTQTFANTTGTLLGQGTWREVQLLIDGQLAGVAWPFPVIFTGGIVPGFWRPIVGIEAFDLRESEIDITPFLPLLLDGKQHSFEIRVASLNDDGHNHASISTIPGSYWLVTGKIFLFTGPANSKTTGSKPKISTPAPQFGLSYSITKDSTGANETLTYSTTANRQLDITSTIHTSSGSKVVSWSQKLSYSNKNFLTQQGLVQTTIQETDSTDTAPAVGYTAIYSYPLNTTTSFAETATSLGLNGTIDRGEYQTVYGPSIFPTGIQDFNGGAISQSGIPFNVTVGGGDRHPQTYLIALHSSLGTFAGSYLARHQNGKAQYFSSTTSPSYSFGTTSEELQFQGIQVGSGKQVSLASRDVKSVNNTLVYDVATLGSVHFYASESSTGPVQLGQELLAEGTDVRRMLGRGKN